MKNARLRSEEIFRAALQAVDPARLVRDTAPQIVDTFRRGSFRHLLLLGCGKAGAVMASALEEAMPDLVDDGLVITKYGHATGYPCHICLVAEAGHPLPDAAGEAATAVALKLVDAADAQTLIVILLSGGGSALLVAPAPGLDLTQKQQVTDLLLRAGADIRELNTVRKHLSSVKGGQLARRAWPATVLTLILSDVIDDPLDVIASGPTAADPSSFADALAVLERYRLVEQVPSTVLHRLQRGATGDFPETPKPGDPLLAKVDNRIIGNNRLALEAAATAARRSGYAVDILTDTLQGEARQAARWLVDQARSARPGADRGQRLCLLAGGETTVIVHGHGLGGRNQELALAFALEMTDRDSFTLLSAGTDGSTDAAGAYVDGSTVPAARQRGLDPAAFLNDNDSYHFFQHTGGLVMTGPTGTNVMDMQIMLLESLT